MTGRKIYKNLFLLVIVIFSYILLIFFISNKGFKDISGKPHNIQDIELENQTLPIQNARFEEIRLNKNFIYIK